MKKSLILEKRKSIIRVETLVIKEMYLTHVPSANKNFIFRKFKKFLRFNNFAQTAASSQLLIGAENSLKVSHKYESYE